MYVNLYLAELFQTQEWNCLIFLHLFFSNTQITKHIYLVMNNTYIAVQYINA
jgi:hypothetical protein